MKPEDVFEILRSVCIINEPVSNARVSCAIVYKNRILSIGVNKKKSHPFQKKYSVNDYRIYLHAEISAIHNFIRTQGEAKLRHSDIFICRIGYSGVFLNSYPRRGCMSAIVEFRLKRLFFYKDGEIQNTNRVE
jgi:deoxycytidylate deaminase